MKNQERGYAVVEHYKWQSRTDAELRGSSWRAISFHADEESVRAEIQERVASPDPESQSDATTTRSVDYRCFPAIRDFAEAVEGQIFVFLGYP